MTESPRRLATLAVVYVIIFIAVATVVIGSATLHSRFLPEIVGSSSSRRATVTFAYDRYIPASAEAYVMAHSKELGFHNKTEKPPTCRIWLDQSVAPTIHDDLLDYKSELAEYKKRVDAFQPIGDLRHHLDDGEEDVCQTVELHEDGLMGIFNKSKQLSYSSSGYVEPLLPPLRHPEFCTSKRYLLDLSYMVHDFGAMCRKMKPTSRTILVDMGASLLFHGKESSPAIYLTQLYTKFGFPFDHIYAYEIKPTPPERVFQKVPEELLASYHWINLGVSSDPESRLNPLKMILNKYNEDDLIIVKLDIDTSFIEVPLARQLLEDDRYSRLIDQFYFEHHVHLREMTPYWTQSMNGSFAESLELFSGLREKGIPSHSWV